MTPKFIVKTEYDFSVDIWSLGVIFYELLTNTPFFKLVWDNLN